MKKLNVLNLSKGLSREEMKTVNGGLLIEGGGFPCYCGGVYKGYVSNVNACLFICAG